MDEKALIDFAPLIPAGKLIRLLADSHSRKPGLVPAAKRWVSQYGTDRPLELRLAPGGTLHDRLFVIDGAGVWILTQSLNALAARKPATISRFNGEGAALKVAAYSEMWQGAETVL